MVRTSDTDVLVILIDIIGQQRREVRTMGNIIMDCETGRENVPYKDIKWDDIYIYELQYLTIITTPVKLIVIVFIVLIFFRYSNLEES